MWYWSLSSQKERLKKKIEYFMVGWLVVFYGISTLEGYSMLNPVYTYILNIYDL